MDLSTLKLKLNRFNQSELFYQSYYEAGKNHMIEQFLDHIDMDFIKENNIIIPELTQTIPVEHDYLDSFFFDMDSKHSICLQKHNCFSPPLLHQHTFFECIYVMEGTCTQSINGTTVMMRTGDICLIPPGVKHTISVFDKSIIINILIRKTTFEDIFFNFIRTDNILSMFFINNIYSQHVNDYIIFHSGNDNTIYSIIINMYLEYVNEEPYSHAILNNALMILFAQLLRHYEETSELPPLVKKSDVQGFALIRFIQDNYTNVTLNDIAEKFHYTPEYTSKLIKDTTGFTFTKILSRIKLEHAIGLLCDTNISVANICHEVGYLNPEHFIRTFKKTYQMTPTEYRRQKSGQL